MNKEVGGGRGPRGKWKNEKGERDREELIPAVDNSANVSGSKLCTLELQESPFMWSIL